MPSTLISTRRGWLDDAEPLFAAVQSAMADTIGVSRDSRSLRLQQFEPGSYTLPRGHGERYTLIEITLLPGRTIEKKQALYAALKRNLAGLGIPVEDVKVILLEAPPENWS